MATVLYTALADLEVSSIIASWPVKRGACLPLDPLKPSTVALLAAGQIELAPPGSTDTSTPPHTLRGQAGLKAPGTVSN